LFELLEVDKMNGQTIKHLRMVYGLNQKEFAEIIGVSVPNLCSIEKGKMNVSQSFEIRVKYHLQVTDEILETVAAFQAKSEELKQRLLGV